MLTGSSSPLRKAVTIQERMSRTTAVLRREKTRRFQMDLRGLPDRNSNLVVDTIFFLLELLVLVCSSC